MVTFTFQQGREIQKLLKFPDCNTALGFAIACIQKYEDLVNFDVSITTHKGKTVIHKKGCLERYCIIRGSSS